MLEQDTKELNPRGPETQRRRPRRCAARRESRTLFPERTLHFLLVAISFVCFSTLLLVYHPNTKASSSCAWAFAFDCSLTPPPPRHRRPVDKGMERWSLTRSRRRKNANVVGSLENSLYGRGSEIWPPSHEGPVRLTDSFPNGQVPEEAKKLLQRMGAEPLLMQEEDEDEEEEETALENQQQQQNQPVEWRVETKRRNFPRRALNRILRRAARWEEQRAASLADSPQQQQQQQQPSQQQQQEQQQSQTQKQPQVLLVNNNKTPAIIALALLFTGHVRPLDLLLVTFLTGYVCILSFLAQTLRRDSNVPGGTSATSNNGDNVGGSNSSFDVSSVPVLPALPPQGHVPTLVVDPLGPAFTYSVAYDRWLQLQYLLGFVGPGILLVLYSTVFRSASSGGFAGPAAVATARPLFLLCCQALTEAVTRRASMTTLPLPIRIFVPVAYNTCRLGYLWNWVFYYATTPVVSSAAAAAAAAVKLSLWKRIVSWPSHVCTLFLQGCCNVQTLAQWLAVTNLAYTVLHLFAFLLPIAVVRYMRAHFWAVEAEQVTIRPGMEENVLSGLPTFSSSTYYNAYYNNGNNPE